MAPHLKSLEISGSYYYWDGVLPNFQELTTLSISSCRIDIPLDCARGLTSLDLDGGEILNWTELDIPELKRLRLTSCRHGDPESFLPCLVRFPKLTEARASSSYENDDAVYALRGVSWPPGLKKLLFHDKC